jgi:putative DNA-invertase from lambdoid prophage Rac
MAVYGYSRVSTMMQADAGESLGVQQRQIEGWAIMQGAALTHLFVERGVSGTVPIAQRPQGSLLWEGLRKGDVVVASKLDRLFRSALDALQTVEALRGKGVSLVMLDLGGDISGNGLSKMFLTIAAAFAEAERDRIRERIVQVKADQKGRGRYLGGKLPYGYSRSPEGDLVAIPEAVAVIQRVQTMRAAGATLRAIQAALPVRLSLDAIQRIGREAG